MGPFEGAGPLPPRDRNPGFVGRRKVGSPGGRGRAGLGTAVLLPLLLEKRAAAAQFRLGVPPEAARRPHGPSPWLVLGRGRAVPGAVTVTFAGCEQL